LNEHKSLFIRTRLRVISAAKGTVPFSLTRKSGHSPVFAPAAIVLAACLCCFCIETVRADALNATRSDLFQGSSNQSARQSAIQAMPMDKLDAPTRAKVHAVLSNVTIFRRMPVRVVDCDPDLYLFLVRHPDVVVSIWNALNISQLQLRQTGPDAFRLKEVSGIAANLEYLYSSHDTHMIYADGIYEGTMFGRHVKGSGVFLLKSSYVCDTDGRYYISSRLDSFISIEPSAVELVAKAIHPLLGYTADNNFSQTIAFAGSLSRTVELNGRGIQRLAGKLENVQPEVRDQFAQLTKRIYEKPSAVSLRKISESKAVARIEKENGPVRR
jgi:hypothetical protein